MKVISGGVPGADAAATLLGLPFSGWTYDVENPPAELTPAASYEEKDRNNVAAADVIIAVLQYANGAIKPMSGWGARANAMLAYNGKYDVDGFDTLGFCGEPITVVCPNNKKIAILAIKNGNLEDFATSTDNCAVLARALVGCNAFMITGPTESSCPGITAAIVQLMQAVI